MQTENLTYDEATQLARKLSFEFKGDFIYVCSVPGSKVYSVDCFYPPNVVGHYVNGKWYH